MMVDDSKLNSKLISIPENLLSISKNSTAVLSALSCSSKETPCGSAMGCGTAETCDANTQGCFQTCSEACSQSCSEGCGQSSTSKPGAGTITIVKGNTTATSITVNISSISGATSYHIVWRKSASSTVIGERTVSAAGNITISGLDPNTSYTFNYYGINSAGTGPYTTGVSETTLSGRPPNWSWTTSFYSGKNLPVHSTNKTYEILPASEWTDFQTRINEFRVYTGMPKFGSFTNVSQGTSFNASIWNEAVYAICHMTNANHIQNFEKSSGDIIYASDFKSLATELNSIP